MKKYDVSELKYALHLLNLKILEDSLVIDDFKKELTAELKKQSVPKFIRATDSYLKKLKREDVYVRTMNEDDEYYYPGMQGLFEKKNGRLLRRHTDTGFLSLPD